MLQALLLLRMLRCAFILGIGEPRHARGKETKELLFFRPLHSAFVAQSVREYMGSVHLRFGIPWDLNLNLNAGIIEQG